MKIKPPGKHHLRRAALRRSNVQYWLVPEPPKKFALQCREIRLHLAKNPGASSFDMKQKFGYSVDRHLTKMLVMGIIKEEGSVAGDPTGIFYVVPQ